MAANRGPYARSAETQALIARAALDLVMEKGHRAVTTADVSQRAGVSETTRFYHFPTRDHLLVAAIRLADRDAEEQLQATTRSDDAFLELLPRLTESPGSPGERISALFTSLQAEAPDPDHPAHDYFAEHNSRATTAFAAVLRRRQAQGLAQADLDPETVARQLLGVWRGLHALWLVDRTFDLTDEIQQAFRRLTGETTMEARRAIDELLSRV